VNLQKIVDCSGLSFPGHGTPAWIVFGSSGKPNPESPIRIVGIVPGGGDLHTPPEDSLLWHTISQHHDRPGYSDRRVFVNDRPRPGLEKWPWNLDPAAEETSKLVESGSPGRLVDQLAGKIGYACVTRADEIYFVSTHVLRMFGQNTNNLLPFTTGDEVGNLFVFPT
jgi:hypothetical protein